LSTAALARLGTEELRELAARAFAVRCSQDAVLASVGAEVDRRQDWRASGATSLGSWLVQQLGVSAATARAYAEVASHVSDLPHLAAGLAEGRLNLDQLRAVLAVATPETDAQWAEAAGALSFKDLEALVRSKELPTRASDRADEERRSLRFNPARRSLVAQLPPLSYAEVRAVLEARVKAMGSEPETPLDQRLADALVSLLTQSGPANGAAGSARVPLVVAHVPFEVLVDPDSTLAGELERAGLISADVVRRLVCDGEVIVALDDEAGHTMYEGRARRDPTPAQRREVWRRDRHCIFPGCAHVLFTDCHHLEEWQAGGPTDLGNLALLCTHHHHLIHTKLWSMTGDANVEVRFVGPSAQVMTTRPSRLWTQVSDPEVISRGRRGAGAGEGAHETEGADGADGAGVAASEGGGGGDRGS
jgi:Domain of unknown function (DUF222)